MFEHSLETRHNRIEHIDLLRAIGIVVMIMGHVPFSQMGSGFDKWIHCFHMPVFFIISGFFYKEIEFKLLLRKRARTLLLPYFAFGLIFIALACIKSPEKIWHYIICLIVTNTIDEGLPIGGALWFLTALFLSDIVYAGVNKTKTRFKSLLMVILTVFGMSFSTLFHVRCPWGADAALVGVGFIECGRLLKERGKLLLTANGLVSTVTLLLLSFLGMINGYVNMRTGEYGIWILFFVNAFGLSVAFWNIARILNEKFGSNVFGRRLKNVGKNSIVYLCLNQFAILVANKFFSAFITQLKLPYIMFSLAVFIMALIELFILEIIITRTKFQVLIGR